MIDKLTLLQYEKPVADAYAEATRMIVENLARHIASGKAWGSATWEIQKLKELGQLNQENAKILNEALRGVPPATRSAMNAASREAYNSIKDMLENAVTIDMSTGEVTENLATRPPEEINAQYIEYWMQTAIDKFNLTNTTMLQSAQQVYLTAINGALRYTGGYLSDEQTNTAYGALNASAAGILSGGLTLQQAKTKTIEKMANAGIYGFVDRAGRHWTPEAYSSMVLRTTVHNVSVQATKATSQEFGVDVFQCSWHPNSRPSHYDFQGKFYSWSDQATEFVDGYGVVHEVRPVSETGYDTAGGLFGVNCGHEPFAMMEGVSIPFEESDIQPKEESDKGYALSQQQRALERAIRDAKTKAEIYNTAGDDTKAAEWNAKIHARQAEMRKFIAETGLKRSYSREKIYTAAKSTGQGAGNVKPAQAAKEDTEKVFSADNPLTEIAKAAKGYGIVYRAVELLKEKRTSAEIIRVLAGADKTRGSCSSLAFAYAGQRAGYDVTDFRGGRSCDFFARVSRINLVEDFGTPIRAAEYNGFTAAHKVLESVEEGKEYRLGVGKHAAIVRKVDGVLQYLELQSGWRENTWYTLDDAELKRRFGVQKSRTSYGTKLMQKASLTDISTLAGDQFRDILGYINTAEGEQKKGAGGGEK